MLDEFEFLKKHASLMLELSMDPAKIDKDSTESEESNTSFVEVTHSTFVLEVCIWFFRSFLLNCSPHATRNESQKITNFFTDLNRNFYLVCL